MSSVWKDQCPFCHKHFRMVLTNDQDRRLWEWRNGDGHIQEKFPELNATEREFLLSGYCPECQKIIFGGGESEKIKEIKD